MMSESEGDADGGEPSERKGQRPEYLKSLITQSRASMRRFESRDAITEEAGEDEEAAAKGSSRSSMKQLRPGLAKRASVYQLQAPERLVEVRLRDVTYSVPVKMDAPSIKTVTNQSVCYYAYELFRRVHLYCHRPAESEVPEGGATRRKSRWRPTKAAEIFLPFEKKAILHDVNLVLKPGKSYVVLGPPGCGKTTLLKAISGRLPQVKDSSGEPVKGEPYLDGRIEFNGVTVEDDPDMELANVVSFVGQHDNHAPLLTVTETFDFAFQCRTGGHHSSVGVHSSELAAELDAEKFTENLTIDGLDLAVCKDTFVGNEDVRGVSGGQRRRVTVGEMMQGQNPVACADEISTGLDAAVTRDIVFNVVSFSKAAKTTRLISLLQPGPETFSLFDEVILLSEGHVIYAGPIENVVDHFASLGYKQPARMDVADFLQSIPTSDGEALYDGPAEGHLNSEQFAEAFKDSEQYKSILSELSSNGPYTWKADGGDGNATDEEAVASNEEVKQVPKEFKVGYQNSFWRSTVLNLKRHFTLWKRDKGYIIGKAGENVGMAVGVGGILFGAARVTFSEEDTPEETSIKYYNLQAGVYSAIFMTVFHISLGTMTSTPDEMPGRSIHYKHYDSKFYQCGAFVIGRLISTIPQRTMEIVAFAIPLYFMVGLDLSAASFFTFLVLLICYTIGVKMMFGILAQTLPKKGNVQEIGTFVLLLMTTFGGFMVYPAAIPDWYIWIYWMNPMAWCMQGLLSNEFTSSKYQNIMYMGSTLDSDAFLTTRGFQAGREWIGYAFAYMIPYTLFFTAVLTIVLKYVRIVPEKSHTAKKSVAIGKISERKEGDEDFNIPFTPVDLTFDRIVYEVKASTGDDTIRLLNEVSGVFESGRMCALMGSSGAGKTTLMDVIAMRKHSGTTTGEIRLNGHLQERTSFLRCSGYVEQFDVQQPELTVLETVKFCARLRLDANDPAIGSDEGKMRYVNHVLETMELKDIENLQVGSYEEGGLTFEQRKRLAIACELAGSPSVLFLDEPTSGLDSRGALVVMRAMKRIADTGRTVCATIHQPSSAVFEMFDDLILLKKGGNVVFFGELGPESVHLVDYFEARGAKPIEYGANPAAWMLQAYAGDEASSDVDWAESFKTSDQFQTMHDKISAIKESPEEAKKITFDSIFATTFGQQLRLMYRRITTVYKRSPAYNLARLVISVTYAFLFGSIFIRRAFKKKEYTENQMDGVFGTIFFSLLIIGVASISMAVPVMKKIRDVFYKHRESGMLEHNSLSSSLLVCETPYIVLLSVLFCGVYYATVSLFNDAKEFGFFLVFFMMNTALYTYFGQAFICLVRDIPTSMALVGVYIGFNLFFSGFVAKPQMFKSIMKLGYWFAPQKYTYEGIITTQFMRRSDDRQVLAADYSPFYYSQGCAAPTREPSPCTGTIAEYTNFVFGGQFTPDNFWLDVGVPLAYLVVARFLTWFSLKKFNYVNT